MINCGHFPRRFIVGLNVAIFLLALGFAQAGPSGGEILPPGFRPIPPGVHALVGARVFIKPGQVLDHATIIIRDGYIQSVGSDITPPPDARVWDMQGLTIYAGFIDPYLSLAPKTAPRADQPAAEPGGNSDESENLFGGGINFFGVNPQQRPAGDNTGPGYEVASVTPERRVAQTFSPDPSAVQKMREIGFTAANVVPDQGIIRGTSAFVALSDAEPTRAIIKPDVFQHVAFEAAGRRGGEGGGRGGRPNAYPTSLMGDIAVVRQSFFDASFYSADQADYKKRPTGRNRPDYNVSLEALASAGEKKMRVVFEPNDALMVDRVTRIAKELDLNFYIVSSGQEWRRPELAKAAGVPFIVPLNYPTIPKMPSDDDWDQITLDQLRAWDWAPENAALLNNEGIEIALTTHGLANKADFRKNLRLALDRGLSETNALAALTTVPARLCGLDNLLGTVEAGKLANLTIVDGKGYFDADSKVCAVWVDGRIYTTSLDEPKIVRTNDAPAAGDGARKSRAEQTRELQKARVARSPLDGRGVLAKPDSVLVRNATIWTSGPLGKIDNGFLLVTKGKIAAVGPMDKLEAARVPNGVTNIDGTGLHVTAGLIDCHSHSMILGAGNEGTLPSSAMVRIGDVINSEAPTIYEQLAGGLTVANVLHGSANPIGGQCQVIKLRDGETPEGLKFEGASPSIKFALGENVKQSSRTPTAGSPARYPQTRMGVRAFYANRFTAAEQYLQQIADSKKSGVPVRRDLELEALGEIIEGKRIIHCHSYRQDEVLSFLRVMEDFNVKVGTLQHILEGYKIADEIAKHGAGASSFADWWAYKEEAFDAIPQNGSLMRERGVLVSFNSDSNDLARRLYTEAAKAVKYGGTSEEEALKFVTINPAKQLHTDKYDGSLEPGKDGDFALWTKAPLDSTTMCLQTWIEGKKYFDSSLTPARTAALAKERADLLAKAKKLSTGPGSGAAGTGGENAPEDNSFFQVSLEHQFDGHDRHCLDDE
jgi:imidazolonepropionase-like amidohydrolase